MAKNYIIYIDITYNQLNLPARLENLYAIEDGVELYYRIYYSYDAAGNKLKKYCIRKDFRPGGPPTINVEENLDYVGNFVYDNDVLKYIITPEGRAMFTNGTFSHYEYDLKDHLGNTRVTMKDDGTVTAKNDYYPFGMLHGGITAQPGHDDNKYLYNGKELQTDFGLDWYDYGARFYDAQLGRWHSIDPAYDLYYNWSPYNYVRGNPIIKIDPNGMWDGDFFDIDLNYLGTDGKIDGQNYVVTNTTDVATITANHEAEKTTQLGDLTSEVDVLPNDAVIAKMAEAVTAAEVDGLHEEGGSYGTDKNGHKAVPAKPGQKLSLTNKNATVNTLDAADPSQLTSDYVIEGTYHVHPSRVLSDGYQWKQKPSLPDVRNAYLRAKLGIGLHNNKTITGNNYVLSPKIDKVYVYSHKDFNPSNPVEPSFTSYNLTKFLNLTK